MSIAAFIQSVRSQLWSFRGESQNRTTAAARKSQVEEEFRRRCATVGVDLRIDRLPFITGAGRIVVGDHVQLSGSSDIAFSNIARPDPELRIGNHTFIGHGCSLYAADSILIGEHCLIAGGTRVQDFDGHPMDAELRRAGKPTPPEGIKPIRIGDLTWIGNNALILKGVTIGERAVVSAMSVVANDVPADALVAGNPARLVKFLNGRARAQFIGSVSSSDLESGVRQESESSHIADNAIEIRIKKVLAELARVPFQEINVSHWVDHYGVDSLKLLVFRETLERELGLRLSDKAWFNCGSVQDIIEVANHSRLKRSEEIRPAQFALAGVKQKTVSTPLFPGRRYTSSGMLYADIEIGMPLTGPNNLAEGPLLQQLGDLRWAHISHMSGVPSRFIADAEGNRLYATFFFVELVFPANCPMASYAPDDRIKVAGNLTRFGTSIVDGTFYLLPPDADEVDEVGSNGDRKAWADVPRVRCSNVFVRQKRGVEHLQRSRPADPGFERIPETAQPPDSYIRVKDAERDNCFVRPPAAYVRMTPAPVTIPYKLDPDRDVNGVGLIYFAHFPVFLDIAERQVLRTAELPLSEELIDRRTLIRRSSAYLGNASTRDTLFIDVEPWIDNPSAPSRLWLNFRMRRASDGRLMMVSTAEKIIFNGS